MPKPLFNAYHGQIMESLRLSAMAYAIVSGELQHTKLNVFVDADSWFTVRSQWSYLHFV